MDGSQRTVITRLGNIHQAKIRRWPSAPVTSSVASGTYAVAQSVVLSTTEVGGDIYYTDDGTIPSSDNNNSILYAAPITLEAPSNTCIKAVCEVDGKTDSDILELYIEVTA